MRFSVRSQLQCAAPWALARAMERPLLLTATALPQSSGLRDYPWGQASEHTPSKRTALADAAVGSYKAVSPAHVRFQ